MRVAVDATILRANRMTGAERCVVELLRALQEEEMPDVELHVLVRSGVTIVPQEKVFVHSAPPMPRVLRDQVWVPLELRRIAPDVTHFASLAVPVYPSRGVIVVTVHDATPWLYPETLSLGGRVYYRPLLQRALRRGRVDMVATVSHAAGRDLRRVFSNVARVAVVPNGLSPAVRGSQVPLALRERFILAVGTIEPRKSLPTLVEAFAHLRSRLPGTSLVIVGRRGWGKGKLAEGVDTEGITFAGHVPDAELRRLYATCGAFVLPSKYEGFGLPLIEAMSFGAPAVASDVPALREVAGDACLYFPSGNAIALANSLFEALADSTLREGLAARAAARASHFSWRKSAALLAALYRGLAGAPTYSSLASPGGTE